LLIAHYSSHRSIASYSSELRFVPTSLAFDTSIREASRQHIAMTFGVEKVEWFGYLMLKNF